MTYHVIYDERARKSLHKMDAPTRKLIIEWIDKNLEGCDDPYCHGKALKGNLKGIWRYRVDDYRILAEIQDGELTILIINAKHRRSSYK